MDFRPVGVIEPICVTLGKKKKKTLWFVIIKMAYVSHAAMAVDGLVLMHSVYILSCIMVSSYPVTFS